MDTRLGHRQDKRLPCIDSSQMTFYKQQLSVLWDRGPYSVSDFVSSHSYSMWCSWVPHMLQRTRELQMSPEGVPKHHQHAGSTCKPSMQLSLFTWCLKDRKLLTGGELVCTEQIEDDLVCPTGPTFSSCFIIFSEISMSLSCSFPARWHSRLAILAARSVQRKHKALPAVPVCFTIQTHSAQHVGAKQWMEENLSSSKDEFCHRLSRSKITLYALPWPTARTSDLSTLPILKPT